MNAVLKLLWTMRFPVVVFTSVMAMGVAANSQSSSTPPGQSNNAPGTGASAQNPTGFAIESEMLTYAAMDSEGTAVACGIAKNVGAADAGCNRQTVSGPPVGVVVVLGGSSALSEFQLWRTDISTMDMLTERATHYCPQGPAQRGLLGTIGSTIMSNFPEGQALSFAQSLLSQTATTAPLEGDILDQTLVNDVAGHLKGLGLDVVIPDTYMPLSLAAIDQGHSPFLSKYAALINARACVAPAAASEAASGSEADTQTEADKLAIRHAIDAFLKSLTEPDVFDVPKPLPGTVAAPQAPVISHLNAVLRADGLAQELDAASPDAKSGANGIWYVLTLKALESGGTLLKSGNGFTGTKTSYSGGAVGTYALFRLNGNVACSGVFFNYAAPTLTSRIPDLIKGTEVSSGKVVGGCSP